jgi:hypothetical protein
MPELNAAGAHPISADGLISIEDKARIAASIDIDPERGWKTSVACARYTTAHCKQTRIACEQYLFRDSLTIRYKFPNLAPHNFGIAAGQNEMNSCYARIEDRQGCGRGHGEARPASSGAMAPTLSIVPVKSSIAPSA